ncbi:hypothetical protein HN51_061425 [Arachis hypogaea]|uniref:Uncharacterized protein n=1 Tax=Arachis hypogaea TaxID=3818 RepID=A0A445ANE4_ARAHY|nr:hypothetical protein Ahy_B01g051949 [Arachis hypogaea]
MAPSGRTITTSEPTKPKTKKRRNLKKQQKRENKKRKEEEVDEVIDDVSGGCCSTPKGEKFRIPEISTCPPAPKKQRVISSSSNCSLRRSPLSFFSPPDLDLFFFIALSRTDVSV